MSKYKLTDQIVRLRCEDCNKLNYNKRKNKKTIERKLELRKFCKWCKKHQIHKEVKR